MILHQRNGFCLSLRFMRKKLVILLGFLLLGCLPAAGQYYTTGAAPTGTKWNRISSEHFDVIFPIELDSLAREYLYDFEKTRTATLTGLRVETPRMPIVLQPYDMYSDGMVVWSPRRLELYTTPPGNALYALNWEMQLAVHEGRHIGQMSHYTNGFYHFLNILAGEQGSAVGIGLYPTQTLMEGDAVQNETDLTPSGRGRDPEFVKYFRAAFLAGDFRSYDAWRYGSFRKYSPGKYPFGYLLTSTMRDNSNNYFATGDIMHGQVKDFWRVFSVSHRSYRRATGLTARKNWRTAIARNTELWQWEYNLRAPYTPYTPLLNRRDAVYTEISNPMPLGNETYAAMSGMQFERRIIRIDSLGQRRFRRPLSNTTSTLVPDSDHSFLFSEVIPDPRWEHRSWSIIRRYDTRTNRFETLTRQSRYLNPVPSAGRDSILAAEYKVEGGSDVVILDRDGQLLNRIAAPEKGQVTGIAQLQNDLYATVITTKGLGLFRYDGDWHRVVAPQSRMIRDLRAAGDSLLYFVSDLDGLSNIYTYEPAEDRLLRRTSVRYSAENPLLTEDGTFLYGEYDHHGYHPVSVPIDSLQHNVHSFLDPYVNDLAERNAEQASAYITPLTNAEDSLLRSQIDQLESNRYSKLTHGIHIHSWAPFYANVNRLINDLGGFDSQHFSNWYQFVAPGVSVMSQNTLGTLSGTAGYSYHDRHHAGHLYARYTGLYPVFEVAADYNERNRTRSYASAERGGKGFRLDTLDKPAFVINSQVSLPLNLSRGGWVTWLTPAVNLSMTNDAFEYKEPGYLESHQGDHTVLLTGTLRFYTQLSRPKARLTPRLGFGVQLSGMTRIGPAVNNVASLTAWTYLPGFGKEDGFKLSYSRQVQTGNGLIYSSSFNLVRRPYGFENSILMNYHRVLLQYALPIYAGDLNGGFFFYLKRLELVPFVDYAFDKSHPQQENGAISQFAPTSFLSYGSTLLVNTRLFRIGTDLKFGVQYARPHRPGDHGSFRFVLNNSL